MKKENQSKRSVFFGLDCILTEIIYIGVNGFKNQEYLITDLKYLKHLINRYV